MDGAPAPCPPVDRSGFAGSVPALSGLLSFCLPILLVLSCNMQCRFGRPRRRVQDGQWLDARKIGSNATSRPMTRPVRVTRRLSSEGSKTRTLRVGSIAT